MWSSGVDASDGPGDVLGSIPVVIGTRRRSILRLEIGRARPLNVLRRARVLRLPNGSPIPKRLIYDALSSPPVRRGKIGGPPHSHGTATFCAALPCVTVFGSVDICRGFRYRG